MAIFVRLIEHEETHHHTIVRRANSTVNKPSNNTRQLYNGLLIAPNINHDAVRSMLFTLLFHGGIPQLVDLHFPPSLDWIFKSNTECGKLPLSHQIQTTSLADRRVSLPPFRYNHFILAAKFSTVEGLYPRKVTKYAGRLIPTGVRPKISRWNTQKGLNRKYDFDCSVMSPSPPSSLEWHNYPLPSSDPRVIIQLLLHIMLSAFYLLSFLSPHKTPIIKLRKYQTCTSPIFFFLFFSIQPLHDCPNSPRF